MGVVTMVETESKKSAPRLKTIVEILSELELDFNRMPQEVTHMNETVHKAFLNQKGITYRSRVDERSWKQQPAVFNYPVIKLSFSRPLDQIKSPTPVVAVPWSGHLGITAADYLHLLKDTLDVRGPKGALPDTGREPVFILLYNGHVEGEGFKDEVKQADFPVVFLEVCTRNLDGPKQHLKLIHRALGDLDAVTLIRVDVEECIKKSNEKHREAEQLQVALTGPFKGLPLRYKAFEVLRWISLVPVISILYVFTASILNGPFNSILSFLNFDLSSVPTILSLRFIQDFLVSGMCVSVGFKWIPRNAVWAGIVSLIILFVLRFSLIVILMLNIHLTSILMITVLLTISLAFDLNLIPIIMSSYIVIFSILSAVGFIAGWLAARKGWNFKVS